MVFVGLAATLQGATRDQDLGTVWILGFHRVKTEE